LLYHGLYDGVLPAKQSDDGIIGDEERIFLKNAGVPLAPTSEIRLLDEEFIAYKAFTTPLEHLVVSYPIADEEGKSLLASPWIKRLREVFPGLEEVEWALEPGKDNEKHFVLNPDVALAHLAGQFQLYKKGYPISEFWTDVYNGLLEIPSMKVKTRRVLSSLFFENKAKPLNKSTTKELYGDEIQASVS
ncbi:hypothetical protein, partial [Streptomyces gulbargensis]|uniref:hypothetical protein n=1 Tax=Streptomyces gulbargensis TaxID=364901 RepID=UPI0031ED6F95